MKRRLTQEEKTFLLELQHEMLTQDTVGQADPRFWVVQGKKRVYTSEEYATNCALIGDDGILRDDISLDSLMEYIQDNYSYELKDNHLEIRNEEGFWVPYFLGDPDDEDNNETYDITTLFDIDEALDFLKEHNIIGHEVSVVYYNIEDNVYPDTMFITNKSCKEHIRLNHYHYWDPHSYAMTAWRSPEVEKLWKILQEVDWSEMKCQKESTKLNWINSLKKWIQSVLHK